ncbi:hypothetical protein [Caulobacter sp. UC70_42]|uniref:hypothetical protein n=1 Tax=Caulobacter sp. UC70_42 TaxID=3374551 RepID=UPI00375752B8
MKAQSLSQRLNLAVVGITLATLVLSLIFIAVGYGLLFEFAPKLVSAEDAILPAPVEWGMYSVCIVLGSIAASVVATRVARRMVEPLETLAEAARQIASGRPFGQSDLDHSRADGSQPDDRRLQRHGRSA